MYEGGWTSNGGAIVCTQPRRIAAVTVATRVAEEFGCNVGEQVGYGTRFDFKCSSLTKIKYYTDHILIREMISDPLLSKYSIVIVDEAHQRTLYTDILLGLLKKIQKKRKLDFRIIITSATLDALSMKNFFEMNENHPNDSSLDTATILSIQGKQFPVDILYLKESCRNYLLKALETIYLIHETEDLEGDILVFLPSSEEIQFLLKLFQNDLDNYHSSEYYRHQEDHNNNNNDDEIASLSKNPRSLDHLIFLPLHANLPHFLQMKVFEPAPYLKRKVILATNIAESSITIENIKYVIDSGFHKLSFFDITSGIEHSIVCEISKSNAIQRAGRAGRYLSNNSNSGTTGGGKCFRLMTEISFEQLTTFPLYEIQRMDLSAIILQLKSLSIHDILHFDFLSIPSSSLMIYSLELLFNLSAIDVHGNLTNLGEQMSEMPIEPKLSKCLLSSLFEFSCTEEMLSIIAMLLVESPFVDTHSYLFQKKLNNQQSQQNLNEQQQERIKKFEKDFKNFAFPSSDHLTLLKVYQSFQEMNYSSSYCDGNSLMYKILYKAKEIRSFLLKILMKLIAKEERKEEKSSGRSSSSSSSSNSALPAAPKKLFVRAGESLPVEFSNPKQSQNKASGTTNDDDEDENDNDRDEDDQHQQTGHEPKKKKQKLSKYVICSAGEDEKTIRKCLISGFFANVAKLNHRGKYQLLRGGKTVEPHPHSVISRYGQAPEYVLFNDVVYNNSVVGGGGGGGGRGLLREEQVAQIREISAINPLWLFDVASHYYDLKM